jgi:hypothetical protein
MKQTAVEWLQEQLKDVKYNPLEKNGYSNALERLFKQAKEMEKEQQGYSEEELFKIINDFCFDWNYNYKGELSQKQYLIEWFERFKKKIK